MISDWASVLVGLGAPFLVTSLEMWLKFVSRTTAPGQPWRSVFTRDDFSWWLQWIITAVVALAAFLLRAARELDDTGRGGLTLEAANQSLSGLLMLLIFILFGGLSFLPTLVSRFGYHHTSPMPGSSVTTGPTLRIGRGIVLPNIVGVIVLLAVVAAGINGEVS